MFELSEEQRMLVSETKRLAENEFAEKAFSWEEEEFPRRTSKRWPTTASSASISIRSTAGAG